MYRWYLQFEAARPFREREAWTLFRLAAFAEAAGWTLLLAGICLKRFVLHGNDTPVLIAGQFHGTLFLLYLLAALGLYPSLGHGRLWAICALAASVPPYGSMIFERFAARQWSIKQGTMPRHFLHRSLYYTLTAAASA